MNKIYTFSDTRKNRKKGRKKTKLPAIPFNKEKTAKDHEVTELSNAFQSPELPTKFNEKAKIAIKKSETQSMDISSNLNLSPHPFSERKNPYPPPKPCPEQDENDVKQESEDYEKDCINQNNLKSNEQNSKLDSIVEITPLSLDITTSTDKAKKILKSRYVKKFIKTTTDLDHKFREFETHKKKENKLDLSFAGFIYDSFKTLFKKDPSPSYKLFSKAQKIFIEEIDLLEILVKIKEFEKFKSILLSEDQLKLFHAIGKPLISINENEENSYRQKMSKLIFESKKVNENEIWNIYKKLKLQKDNNSEINKRLLALLDEKIKEYKEMNDLQEKEMIDC